MPKVVDHDQRRADVAAATWAIIERKGVAATRLQDVAREAGCTTGALAHYFDGKTELVDFALTTAVDDAAGRIVRATRGKRGLEAIRATALEVLPLDAARRREWVVFLNYWTDLVSRERAGDPHEYSRDIRRGLRRRFAEAVELGELAPGLEVELEVERLLGLIYGLGLQVMVGAVRLSKARLTTLVDSHLDGLSA